MRGRLFRYRKNEDQKVGETFDKGSRMLKVNFVVLLEVPKISPFPLTYIIWAFLQNLWPHLRPTESASSFL